MHVFDLRVLRYPMYNIYFNSSSSLPPSLSLSLSMLHMLTSCVHKASTLPIYTNEEPDAAAASVLLHGLHALARMRASYTIVLTDWYIS